MLRRAALALSLLLTLFSDAAQCFSRVEAREEQAQGAGFHRIKRLYIPRPDSSTTSLSRIYLVYQSFSSDFFIDRYQIERIYRRSRSDTLMFLWLSEPRLDVERSKLGSPAFEAIFAFELSPEHDSDTLFALALPFHLRYPQLGPEPYTEAVLDEALVFQHDRHEHRDGGHSELSADFVPLALLYVRQNKGFGKQTKIDHIPTGQPGDTVLVDWMIFSVLWCASLYLALRVWQHHRQMCKLNKIK